MEKEVFVIQFDTQKKANYWMEQFFNKFQKSILQVNKSLGSIEFDDSIYYFWTPRRTSGRTRHATIYTQKELYIILDDVERKRLDTYEEAPDGTEY